MLGLHPWLADANWPASTAEARARIRHAASVLGPDYVSGRAADRTRFGAVDDERTLHAFADEISAEAWHVMEQRRREEAARQEALRRRRRAATTLLLGD